MRTIAPARKRAIPPALLDWYARHKRDLPWRRRGDAYAIWVSEIMLQQTRVETVQEYYRRFLEAFPTVEALARAPLEKVLKLWEGLGYYSRARNLHKAAQAVAALPAAGQFPREAAALRRLPGIGEYTAGAIASIAFGQDEAVLDGNVIRVLSRLELVEDSPATPAGKRLFWTLARGLVPAGRAGDFNQAMMDLGATVCTPRAPRCEACPLKRLCRALARGLPETLPTRRARRALPHQAVVAGVIWWRGRVLVDRRHERGLLGGLWEFPGGKVEPGETLESALAREVKEEVGLEVEILRPLVSVEHSYSHFRITLSVLECRRLSGQARPLQCSQVRWVRPEQLRELAFPAANQKIISLLLSRRHA